MKLFIAAFLFLSIPVFSVKAQTPEPALPTNAVFLGAGFNSSLPEQRAVGSAAYLHQISGNVYMFTRYDVLGVSKKPFGVQTVVTAGACEILHQIKSLFLGGCLDGGTAVSGTNIGGSVGADGLAGYRFGKNKNWAVVVMGGIVKTALSSSINPIRAGLAYGWGK